MNECLGIPKTEFTDDPKWRNDNSQKVMEATVSASKKEIACFYCPTVFENQDLGTGKVTL